jgi:dsRNA-specific ribonuclease
VVRIERILGYVFNNKKLLEEALTEPFNDTSIRPNYERLEFLGDSVLDVVAASAWSDRGEPLRQVCTKAQVTVNNEILTACRSGGRSRHGDDSAQQRH